MPGEEDASSSTRAARRQLKNLLAKSAAKKRAQPKKRTPKRLPRPVRKEGNQKKTPSQQAVLEVGSSPDEEAARAEAAQVRAARTARATALAAKLRDVIEDCERYVRKHPETRETVGEALRSARLQHSYVSLELQMLLFRSPQAAGTHGNPYSDQAADQSAGELAQLLRELKRQFVFRF